MRSKLALFTCVYLAGCASSTPPQPPGDPLDLSVNDSDAAVVDMRKVDLSGGDLSGGDMSGTSVTQACNDYAMAFCMKAQTCYLGYLKATYGDLTTCVSRKQVSCPKLFTAPGTSLTPARWETCAQAISTETCAQFLSSKPLAACAVQPGSLAAAAPCLYDDQCASTRCKRPAGSSCGTCITIQPTGGTCSSSTDCPSDERCSPSNVCAVVVGSGATCDATHLCDYGYHCNSSTSGTCVANVALNGTCSAPSDCAYYLDCISNTCQDGGFAAPGAACGRATSTTPWVYCTKGACSLDMTGQKGTCNAEAADGTSCNTAMATYCVPPASCVSSTCTILDPMSCM